MVNEMETHKKIGKYVVYGLGSFFGLIFLFNITFGSYTTISPGERGVYIVLSKARDTVLDEGFHFKLPFVSHVKKISVRVQKSQSKAEAASRDMQKVSAVFALNWHVDPATVVNLYRNIGDEEAINERVISPAVSEVLKASTSKFTAEEILTHRLQLKSNIDELLIARLSKYNVIVDDISLVDLEFTHEFNVAVEQKQIMEQDAKKAAYSADKAAQEAKSVVNAAKGDAEARLINARATAESQRLMQNTVTPKIIQLEYLKRWDGVLPQIMTGDKGSMMMFNMGDLKSNKKSSNEGEE